MLDFCSFHLARNDDKNDYKFAKLKLKNKVTFDDTSLISVLSQKDCEIFEH